METRELIQRLVALFDSDGVPEESGRLEDSDIVARQPRRPDYEPSPDAIRSATLAIQSEWSEDDWLIRSGKQSRPAGWVVPSVKVCQPINSNG
jgi:hypothetical protein